MAEEGSNEAAIKRTYTEDAYSNPMCNLRIEEIAKPLKWKVKIMFKAFKKLLPERSINAVIMFLREEFAKPPDVMEKEFKELRHKLKEKKCRKICKKEARKKHFAKLYESRKKNMLNILKDILKKYMAKAFFHPKHIIMTTRLRRVSNIVLKELCSIRGIPVPQRESSKIRSQLMYSVADFFAFCIDMIYYEMQVQKVTDYEKLKEDKEKIVQKVSDYEKPKLDKESTTDQKEKK